MIKRSILFLLAICFCLFANAASNTEKIKCSHIIPEINNTYKLSNAVPGEIRVWQDIYVDGSGFSWIISFFQNGKRIASQSYDQHDANRRISMITDEETGSVFITCLGNPNCEYVIGNDKSPEGDLYYVLFKDSNNYRYLALIDSIGYNKIIRQLNAAAKSNIIDLYKQKSSIGTIGVLLINKGLFIDLIHLVE